MKNLTLTCTAKSLNGGTTPANATLTFQSQDPTQPGTLTVPAMAIADAEAVELGTKYTVSFTPVT